MQQSNAMHNIIVNLSKNFTMFRHLGGFADHDSLIIISKLFLDRDKIVDVCPITKLWVHTQKKEQIEIFSEHLIMNVGMISIICKNLLMHRILPPL